MVMDILEDRPPEAGKAREARWVMTLISIKLTQIV